MALIFIDGFDGADYNLGKYNGFGAHVLTSATSRFGTGLSLFPVGTSSSTSTVVRKDFPAVAKVIIGVAHYSTSFDNNTYLFTTYGDSGTINHVNLRIMLSGAVQILRGTTQIAISPPGVCIPSAWHYIELSATISDTVGVVTARVDGVVQATFTGDTKNAGVAATIDRVDLCNLVSGPNSWFEDDFYIADGTGAAPWNDFLGDVRVQTMRPNGAGSSTQLIPVGSGNNWDNVNEVPPSVADYNYSTTPGARDLYTMDDLGLGTTTVLGVQVVTIAQKTDASPRSIKNLLKSGATVYPSATRALAATPTPMIAIYQTNPATSAQWTVPEANAIEAGIEVV
jgi:hypothetical protein